ncbi:MAG: ABC transporter permease [Bryobacterales bacterium]|nr:ABC transporter permease [Bryobacterales bacterium]
MRDLLGDARFALRRLAHTPAFTLAVVVTLALGIGSNTAIFSVIHGVLLKALPYPEPERLIGVWQTAPGVKIEHLNASLADYITYREESRTFADVALWAGRSITVTEFSEPERVDALLATFRLLPLLGMQPMLGRGLVEKDNEEGSPRVLLISHAYWQRRFGGSAKAIGRRIKTDGEMGEIVGVLPKGAWLMDQPFDVVVPLRYNRANVRLAGYNYQAMARLRPGVTLDQANADVARMIRIAIDKLPPPNGLSKKMLEDARLGPNVRPLRDDLVGDIGKSLWVVMATIAMVLLIACANVANLLLVRAEGRGQEFAVRAALGAGRARLAREMLMESLLLALAGGVLGIGFALGALKLVLELSPVRLPRLEQIAVDPVAMLFTVLVSVAAGLGFGAFPVWKHAGAPLALALRSSTRSASAGRERHLARNTLTVVQVALALVLLVASGLMIRTFLSMRRVDPGFQSPETLQTLRVSIPRRDGQKDEELRLVHQNIVNRLAALPGVTAVSLMGGLPMTNNTSQDPVFASDRTYADNQIPPLRRFLTAAPGTFATLGAPLVAGREFTWTEIHGGRRVVIVGANFAREYWGSAAAALGKQIRQNTTDPWSEIIGVAPDIHHDGVEKKAPSSVYWPLRSHNSMSYLIRGPRAGSESFTTELRQAVWAVNGSLPVTDMQTMRRVYDRSMARTAFTLTLLGLSGGMALLLAAVGIYAVISYTVAQRTREVGIRLALGAQQSAVKLMFVRNGLQWGAIGTAVGLAAAAMLSRLMAALLFDVNPVDPLTYGAVTVGLLAAAAVASYLPARRVTRVDPVEALRSE